MGEASNLVDFSRAVKQQSGAAPSKNSSNVLSRDQLAPLSVDANNRLVQNKPLPAVVRHVKSAAVVFLSGRLSKMFDALDDVLFGLADRARNSEEQSHYFDAMRELRRQRWLVGYQFKNKLAQLFNALFSSDLNSSPQVTLNSAQIFSAQTIDAEVLPLVMRMVQEAREKLAIPLSSMQQYLDEWLPASCASPLDPWPIFHVFLADSSLVLNQDKKIKFILMGQFYRQVIARLPYIIDQVNGIFSSFSSRSSSLTSLEGSALFSPYEVLSLPCGLSDDVSVSPSSSPVRLRVSLTDVESFESQGLEELLQCVQQLKLGSWVEFSTLQGGWIACQLAAKNSSSQKFIFSDKRGKKILEQEPIAIATAIRQGRLKIISERA